LKANFENYILFKAEDMERAGERETAEQTFVCDELSYLTDLLKVGLVAACAAQFYQ
jgi:hypothetical protein